MSDDRLMMAVTHADGRVTRWGGDEPNAADIPDGLSFSTSIPGGFKDATWSLPRRVDLEYADLNLYDDVHIYGAGGRTAWQGRMQQFPRSHGDSIQISPSALGYSCLLRDFAAFREIYMDRDLSHWRTLSTARRIEVLNSGGFGITEFAVASDASGSSSIVMEHDGEWVSTAVPFCDAWYDAGAGVSLGGVRVSWQRGSASTSASWSWRILLSTLDLATGSTLLVGSDLQAEPASSGTGSLPTDNAADYRYAVLQFFFGTAAANTSPGQRIPLWWSDVRVFGDHGLTIRGSTPEEEGYYASDVIENAVSRCAPQLDTSRIEATSFVIPHLAFPDPVTCEDVIVDANKFDMCEWGVDEDGFFYRAPDPERLTWQARLSSGARLDLEGDTGETIFNGALVFFNDAAGIRRVVGPPAAYWPGGTALADYTDTVLVDTAEDNPANMRGLTKWAKLELSFPTTQAGATAIGVAYLREKQLPQRRGTLVLQGTGAVEHPTRAKRSPEVTERDTASVVL